MGEGLEPDAADTSPASPLARDSGDYPGAWAFWQSLAPSVPPKPRERDAIPVTEVVIPLGWTMIWKALTGRSLWVRVSVGPLGRDADGNGTLPVVVRTAFWRRRRQR